MRGWNGARIRTPPLCRVPLKRLAVALALCFVGCTSQRQSTLSPGDLEAEFRGQIEEINRRTGARQISVSDLMEGRRRGNEFVVLDIREGEEFQVGSLVDAVLVPPDRVSDFSVDVGDRTTIVTYCTVGYRSGLAAVQLEALLGRPVYNLDGGIIHWFNQGGEVVDTAGRESDRIHPYDSDWERFVMDRE